MASFGSNRDPGLTQDRNHQWLNSPFPRTPRSPPGKTWPKPQGAKSVTEFRIYRYDPDSGRQSAHRHLFRRSRRLRPDGSRRAHLDQIEDRPDADLPPLLPRRHLRLLRDEYRRRQHARLHAGHGRGEAPDQDLSLAAYAGGQGSRAGPDDFLCAARLDRALAAHANARAREGMAPDRRPIAPSSTGFTSASCAPAAPPPARAIGGTASAISARPRCCRPIAG